ncbi:cation:proton antiporter [Pinibacter aurantiacus]|uniref:Cation:proton antiporter n=1 Tax=Pinibacter aurantiacus TaxID=2851599 RepID=A0A9E2SGW3_9BACT|nr:cation:proton antiporter [Pinibacter aurantiacus]MBV4360625.1 cation:proton antiporter [Pinibacter aurantiacus]
MPLLNAHNISLPIADPVLKFLLELIIILGAPLLLNKVKVPHLIGLIVAGAIVGPNGFNLLARDSSVVVTGTTGLLYIMFLAGLEIDMGEFKKNKWKSLTFAVYTFSVPFILGFIGGHYILHFSLLTTLLFASLFSSHTLIAYPLVSKLGITKNRSVNILVGGTMITDVLSLLVLAAVVGLTEGNATQTFWIKLGVSCIAFGLIVLLLFPIIAKWFFKNVEDKISQYIFVLVVIYLAALIAELAGIEDIIGAFFAGLALNRLIPRSSALMNRVEFVGNAIFIPFFLISVGMLVDFRAFIQSWETLGVAGIMIVSSIGGKWLAALITQKTFRLTNDEGKLIFGLSSASAAATLASVMVGYNIIVSETAAGEPVRLLSEHVLNGSILLILISCTVSSLVTMSAAQKIATATNESTVAEDNEEERILIAIKHQSMVDVMVNVTLLLKSKANTKNLFAINVINEEKNESSVKNAEKVLEEAVKAAAAADVELNSIMRYDNDVMSGINNAIKEQRITDLIIGLQQDKGFSPSLMYNLYNGYLQNDNINVMLYNAAQPISTVKSYTVLIPQLARQEPGFLHVLIHIWNIARNSGATMNFYANGPELDILQAIHKKSSIEATFQKLEHWKKGEEIAASLKENEALFVILAKRGMVSYTPRMKMIPDFLNGHLQDRSFMLFFPFSEAETSIGEKRAISNHSDFMEIGRAIKKLFG